MSSASLAAATAAKPASFTASGNMRLQRIMAVSMIFSSHLHHVHSSREIEILIKQIAVPVFFGSPCLGLNGPRGKASTSFIASSIQGIKHCLISGKGFLRDHITHQNNKVIIGNLLCPFPELVDLVIKTIGIRIREKVGGLPTFLDWFQVSQDVVLGPSFQRFEDLNLTRRHGVGDLSRHLPWRRERLFQIPNIFGAIRNGGDHGKLGRSESGFGRKSMAREFLRNRGNETEIQSHFRARQMGSVASVLKNSPIFRTLGLIGGKWIEAYDHHTLQVNNSANGNL